jgi:hypothetical protein
VLDDLPHLRGLYNVAGAAIPALVSGRERGLIELGCFSDENLLLDECAALPHLRALTLAPPTPMLDRLPATAIAKRLERVTIVGLAPRAALVERLLELPVLTELTFHGYDGNSWLYYDPTIAPFGIELRVTRDRRVRAAFHGSMRVGRTVYDVGVLLATYLAALPADITSLELAPSRAFRFDTETRRTIAGAVARFKRLERYFFPK